MASYIGDIAEYIPSISLNEISRNVDKLFTENSKLHGIVVVKNDEPFSLITRADFYQKLGHLYGYNLYMGRPIELIATKKPLIVDYFESITIVSTLAMQRKEEDRYDYVIVTKENKYVGVVSIQRLLMKLVDIQVEFASLLNPLTRLPGNHIIKEKMNEMFLNENFTILYFDLDHFKIYNDTYGFKKGDDLLKSTADLLKRACDQKGIFLGHIGGDDFIAMFDHYEYQSICDSIIHEFDHLITNFYHSSHLAQQYVIAENRQGVIDKIPLVSLSIAVVTNQDHIFTTIEELTEYTAIVKKQCKMVRGSCFIDKLTFEHSGL